MATQISNHISSLSRYWDKREEFILPKVLMVMIGISLIWLGYEFWRLLFQELPHGAIDLRLRQYEIWAWIDGEPVYQTIWTSVYPPASYLILWPFMGWLSTFSARILWAVVSVAALVWLSRQVSSNSLAKTSQHKWFALLLPVSIYASGATIGNGQLGLAILPALIAACLLFKTKTSLLYDLAGACLFAFALVKPSFTAPFFWLVVFYPGRVRPAVLVCGLYALVTLFAASFQSVGVAELIAGWTNNATGGVFWGSEDEASQAASTVLTELGRSQWSTYVSLVWIVILGFWMAVYRRVDVWILLSVSAFVSRLWTYHMWYDDIVMIIPMIALLRFSRSLHLSQNVRELAGLLFAIFFLFSIAPGGQYLLPSPFNSLYVYVQLVIWITTFMFFVRIAETEQKRLKLVRKSLLPEFLTNSVQQPSQP
jgi:hypothetical protein